MPDQTLALLAQRAQLTEQEVRHVWTAAAEFDDSLAIKQRMARALSVKRIKPLHYSRSRLFGQMACCAASLFKGFPIPQRAVRHQCEVFPTLIQEIRTGFGRTNARVRTHDAIRYMNTSKVLDRWLREQLTFGVTDLHYIGRRFDKSIDTSALNDFNLLTRGTEGYQSQDSMVISARGAVTDSHSDDHSGSNHSFVGTKLWLLWETLEGFQHGLEDVSYCDVRRRAAFDMSAFLAMRSSCWILIGTGQTMFIPAHLSHKVITLEKYIGLGSFHAALPGFVDLLERWARLRPRWTLMTYGNNRCSVEFITSCAIRKVRSLRKQSESERVWWGTPYLMARLKRHRGRHPGAPLYSNVGNDPNLLAFKKEALQL